MAALGVRGHRRPKSTGFLQRVHPRRLHAQPAPAARRDAVRPLGDRHREHQGRRIRPVADQEHGSSAMIERGRGDSRPLLRAWLPVAGAFAAITVALTYPLVTVIGSAFPHDAGDPVLNAWILWWSTQKMPLTTAWWNAPMFYPMA